MKTCVAGVPTPFDAVRHTVYVPPSPARGVPSRMAVVPAARTWSVMLAGSVDGVQPPKAVSLTELASGVPVVVMSNTPAVPAEKVAWSPLVMAGADGASAPGVGVLVGPARRRSSRPGWSP